MDSFLIIAIFTFDFSITKNVDLFFCVYISFTISFLAFVFLIIKQFLIYIKIAVANAFS